ncbi:MAG: DUF4194 domain-containing protein [Pseudomonadota bacterium]|nr:DUF4194 domain-containing protein [Pseudomonadota bacterium]
MTADAALGSTSDAAPAAGGAELSAVLIPLLKGVTYRADDAAHWSTLLQHQGRVRDHAAVLGLELMLDEAEGHAFLRAKPVAEDDPAAKLPRLVARRPLSFPVSLLLALLRKKLAESDAGGGETRLILSKEQVTDLLRVFMPDASNEARLIDQVDTHLNRVAELGFVRKLRGQDGMFEVQRIIKSFVDAQWLGEFDARLAAYRTQLQTPGSTSDEG